MSVVTTQLLGYAEQDYADTPYASGVAGGNLGMQATLVNASGSKPVGMQANGVNPNGSKPVGMEALQSWLAHHSCAGYAESPYAETPYATAIYCAASGMQVLANNSNLKPVGMQASGNVVGATKATGMQALMKVVDFLKPVGMQAKGQNSGDESVGMQTEFVIKAEKPLGMQTTFVIDALKPMGMQANAQTVKSVGMQTLVALYNTTNLRILCEFPSRGASTGAGNNAWGNPIATGENWQASSTEPGDFSPFNLNTDITEQYWRTATGVTASITLDCDTEIAQGVFLDTLSVQNHNLSKAATVSLIGSNTDDFSVVGTIFPIQVTDDNLYYIAPTLPIAGYRYWRFVIDDSTNPDGFIRFGTIIFGAAQIFQGECFTDEINFNFRDFADTVRTEGFTNSANSRTQKRLLNLDFRSIRFSRGNFQILRGIFKTQRTVLKCLYIPTPDETDMEVTDRFSVFGKLSEVPVERHNFRGPNADYTDVSIEVDESL